MNQEEARMHENDAKELFINPYYAITVSPILAIEHEPMVPEEQWIKVNLDLMEQMGNEAWLKQLLTTLKTNSAPSGHAQGQPESV